MTSPTTQPPQASKNAFDVLPEWAGVDEDVFAEPQQAAPAKSALRSTLEWGAVIVGALLAALIIKTFLFQAYYIPSSSMEDTLQISDRVLVNKLAYQFGSIEHGDIIVFHRPENAGPGEIDDFIKRVIGLPGDRLHAENGQVFRNGVALEETYLAPGVTTLGMNPVVVPEGHVWVMGDNRTNSSDSRNFGPIPIDSIVGEAFIRVWPPSQFGGL